MPDVLSAVLRTLRLKGGVFLDARFTAPWAVSSYVAAEDCRPILAEPAHMIAYHFLIEGRMLVSVAGEPPVDVQAGDIVLLPRNDTHVLASAAGLTPVDGHHLVRPAPDGGLARVEHGGGGEPVRMVCGFLGCDDLYNPLVASLPRLLTIDMRDATSRDLIEASMRFAVSELLQGRLAANGMLGQLSELLLVEAIRRYANRLEPHHSGWLAGLRDPGVGRALTLIHDDIAHDWSTEDLARAVAMSRSAFVERFSSLVGMPPIRYQTTWRMEAAKGQLRETAKTVAQIGHTVGYESEEAFSRAFKREVGASPARWRESQSSGSP